MVLLWYGILGWSTLRGYDSCILYYMQGRSLN